MFSLAPRPMAPDRSRSFGWLICLDLQRDYVVPGRPRYVAANAGVVEACRAVLGHARQAGWRVVHNQMRRETGAPTLMFGAPIEGLRPLVSESVFFRQGLSAFANPAFANKLREAREADVYLIGFSLADTCLATALAARDEGLSLTLIEDAIGSGGAACTAEAARAVLRPHARLIKSAQLFEGELELAR